MTQLLLFVAKPGGEEITFNLECAADRCTRALPALMLLLCSCCLQGVLGRRETDAFTFNLPPTTNRTRPYRVLLMLRTVDGSAQL
jgi:hypothetical protein